MSLPVVNIVTVLVMACSSSFSRAKQNFARATLIVFGVFLGLFLLIGLTFGAMSWEVRRRHGNRAVDRVVSGRQPLIFREGHEAAVRASRHFRGLPVRSRPRS